MPFTKELRLATALGLWALAAVAYALCRAWLLRTHGLPPVSPGLAVAGAALICLAYLAVDPPRLVAGGEGLLWRLALGLSLLLGAQASVFYRVEAKEKILAPALGALLLGSAWLAPGSPKGRTSVRLAVLGALALLAGVLGYRSDIIVQASRLQPLALAAWLALGLSAMLATWAWSGAGSAGPEPSLGLKREALGLSAVLLLALALRAWQLGSIPSNFWYDEVNLARATQERVLEAGRAPLYVGEQVENPGAYLWVGAALFKVFGAGVEPYRVLAAFFGMLALLPFFGLARAWLGPRWALLATALFAAMRWTLIPQRIGFMSGFALFWMLAAFYFLWSALLRRRSLDWLALGLCLGANLHTYTPSRAVPLVVGLFLLAHWRRWPGSRLRSLGLMLGGFALTGGPMLLYIAGNWSEYTFRSSQVSVLADLHSQGGRVLWENFIKHLLMFGFKGDFNARHNLHFYPHLDFLMAAASWPALIRLHALSLKDLRARFALFWFWPLLAGGIFSMAVEAPQGHRAILVAPLLPLAIAWMAKDLAARLGSAFQGRLPLALTFAAASLLAGSLAFNAYDYFGLWAKDAATWRGFSPRSSAIARLVVQAPPDQEIFLSPLSKEYQFHGYEASVFARFYLKQQDRTYQVLHLGAPVPGYKRASPPASVLAIWVESDTDISEAFKKEYPDIPITVQPDPFDPVPLYLSAVLPFERIPEGAKLHRGQAHLFRR